MNIEAKLGLNVFKIDEQAHIIIDHRVCQSRCQLQPCLFVCPAKLFTLDAENKVQVDFEGCLECGACFIACTGSALTWFYPRAGHGVQYRFG
ncbi:MAG: ferredoxin family protein [Anaerolineales bacterium]|nr:ferredoxin family protein [Anaerolineales bacterium]